MCLVLCLKEYIPIIEPILPPITAIDIRVASFILHSFLIALFLSMYIEKKAIELITIKYIRIKQQ